MLRAYLDDSGKARDPQHAALCVGGYVLPADEWDRFDYEWSKVLRKHDDDLRYFHCREAMHLRGAFSEDKGWSRARVDQLYQDLLATLSKHRPRGFAAVVDLEHYRRVFPTSTHAKKWDDPYFLCLGACLAIIHTEPPWEDKIAVVIDRDDDFRPEAQRMFDDLGLGLERIEKEDFSFGNMRTACGLQAADVLAWEARKHADEHLRGTTWDMRKSFQYLLDNLAHELKFFDEVELQRLKSLR
jgi:hypothetical protein